MIEGHGTGTRLGDRTELRSLAATYGNIEPAAGALLGSVKSTWVTRWPLPVRSGWPRFSSRPNTARYRPPCTPTRLVLKSIGMGKVYVWRRR